MSPINETPAGKAGARSDLLGGWSQSQSNPIDRPAQFVVPALPSGLAVLAAYRQFVVWKLVPSARAGKMDKLPCDWRSGKVTSAHNPATWGTFEECRDAVLAGHGQGVGFVLTARDPFFCLDIDNALQPDNQWSPLAVELCQRFAGAYVEVSQSGCGLHIIGSASEIPPHACKNVALGLELYHEKRFVALTFLHWQGDAS